MASWTNKPCDGHRDGSRHCRAIDSERRNRVDTQKVTETPTWVSSSSFSSSSYSSIQTCGVNQRGHIHNTYCMYIHTLLHTSVTHFFPYSSFFFLVMCVLASRLPDIEREWKNRYSLSADACGLSIETVYLVKRQYLFAIAIYGYDMHAATTAQVLLYLSRPMFWWPFNQSRCINDRAVVVVSCPPPFLTTLPLKTCISVHILTKLLQNLFLG